MIHPSMHATVVEHAKGILQVKATEVGWEL